jgi:CheY-like chemotaxis protein
MMNDSSLSSLSILVVEDEYMLAMELRSYLAEAGAIVVGPVGTIEDALALIDATPRIDIAILDASLQGEMVYPVADRLEGKHIPFVFTTGYDASIIPARFKHIERFDKPTSMSRVGRAISRIGRGQTGDKTGA